MDQPDPPAAFTFGTLLTMRLTDMTRKHPDQDESRVCSRCRQQVAIYPTGQKLLNDFPDLEIVCNVCAVAEQTAPLISISPIEVLDEMLESVPAKKQQP